MQVVADISFDRGTQIGVGQGMNSEVFLIDDDQLGGTLALKEIPKTTFGNNPADYFKEAEALFSASHLNVVPVQYACQTATHVCIAMPYFPQGSLQDQIDSLPLQLSEALRVGDQVLSGLAHIHVNGYLHFDLKPSNVLFSDTQVPMVADFGQARRIQAGGVVAAPPMYPLGIPPEVYQNWAGTVESDVYQVGLLLYRAVNGDPFFQQQVPQPADRPTEVQAGRFPNRNRFFPHVPRRLKSAIRKALKVNPQERFASATDFADELARISLALDWRVEALPGGGLRWAADRGQQPEYVVELAQSGGHWDVQVFTDGNGGRRAKGRSQLWATGLTRVQSFTHLRRVVFPHLEGR